MNVLQFQEPMLIVCDLWRSNDGSADFYFVNLQ